jgi:uncharacterized protein YjiS (DUF1127 family)
MSYYAQTKPSVAVAARRTFSLRSVFNRVVDRLRAAGRRRRQCQELMDYLASDHRAAADLGITPHDARNLCRYGLPVARSDGCSRRSGMR